MSDIGKAFDKRFGTNSEGFRSRKHLGEKTPRGKASVPFQRGPVQTLRMTATQRKWIELMFPENQTRKELICCLKSVSGKVDCAAVRYVDFAPLDEYYSGCEGSGLVIVLGNMPVIGDWGKLRGYKGDGFYRFSWKFTNRNPRNECEICVDASVPLEFVSAKELVLSIVQSVKKAGSRDLDQLNRDDETIQNELTNSDDKVFLYELLQNANDYPCPGKKVRVEIRLDKDCLCFRHTGCEFSALNVNALCSAGAGDKSDNPNAIGYKGIGFKTVFRNNSRVYLKSGEYSFWFDRERAKQEVRINAPWRRVPIWDDVNYSDMGDFRVGFKLYPDRPELLDPKNENGYRCILRRLFKDERVLLFIPELLDVSIQTSVNEKWCVSKHSSCWCVSNLPPVELPDSVKDEIDREVKAKNIPPKLKGKERTLVTFACNINDRRLLPVENACLYCFLPAERARWGFPFLMNTDMVPTGPRDDVRTDLKLNRQLSRIAGEEFCKWIISLLKSGKYDYDSVFALIPDFEECINKAEIPAVKEFLQEFRMGFESGLEQMVLPTNDGSCVPASECVFDKTGVLRKFGSSFWMRLNDNRCIVAEQLWGCDAFARFVERYGDRIGINTYDFAYLRNSASSSTEFAKWIQNPMANGAFLRFIVEAGVLKTFKDAPIFLDNHKNVGSAAEMYFYGPGMQRADRCLGAFSKCYRCLSKDSACLEEIGNTIKDSFRGFNPRSLIEQEIFADNFKDETLAQLKDVAIARSFFAFIAEYKTYRVKRNVRRSRRVRYWSKYYQRYCERDEVYDTQEVCEVEYFPREYLGKLPMVLDDGSSLSHILDDGYDVFDSTCEGAEASLIQEGWINRNTVKIINHGYFEGEDRDAVRNLFKSKRLVIPLSVGTDGFGEYFRNVICRHLDKNCSDDKLVAFHGYMQRQVAADLLVSKPQFDALKNTQVIVRTKDGVRRLDGCDGVLICRNPLDVQLEISEDRLPETAKVLDPRLCGTAEMVEYWQKLGCVILDEEAVLKQKIAAYHECQRQAETNAIVSDEFKTRHIRFVKSILGGTIDVALLKGVKLLDANGRLTAPKDLVLPEVYNPKCHFQVYGCDLNYVSACYSEGSDQIEEIAEYLLSLGVRDEFREQDVGLLADKDFCKYYWTEYVASHAPDDEVIKAMKDKPSVLDRTGCVRKPSELYSACLEHPYLEKIGDANKLLPLCEGVNTKFYENLDFMDSLTASDAISFLLEDSEGTDYQFRGRALAWIADGNLLPADKERYRNDKRATWKNLNNGQMTHVEKLCVIKSHGANRVRAHFGNSEFVMDLRNISNGEQQIGKGDIERAFEKLGVALVDNSTLEPLPSGEAVDGCIKKDVKVRLLILLAVSGEDNWAEEYTTKEAVLDGCSFKICDSIVESCAMFDQLKSEHGKFSEKDGVAYYVGGWQNKHVYLDVVKYLKRKLKLDDQFTDEDLKEAFDTDGGDCGLTDKILSEGDRLLRNDLFMQMLQGVSSGVWQAVKDRVVELERKKLSQKDLSNEEPHDKVGLNVEQEKDSSGASQDEKSHTVLSLNDTENNSPPEHDLVDQDVDKDGDAAIDKRRKGLEEKYGNIEDEEYELLKLIDDDLSLEEKQDQSKLACIRLFRYLQAAGLEPSMYGSSDPEHVVRTLYAEFRRGPNINIKTGKTIHVISAMGGLAYFPPRWWRSLTTQFDGTKEICILYGARAGEFKFIRQYRDVLQIIDDKAIVVKISGQDANERMTILSKMFDNVEAPGKVYGLLKMRDAGDRYRWAFMNSILATTDEENHSDEVISKEEY